MEKYAMSRERFTVPQIAVQFVAGPAVDGDEAGIGGGALQRSLRQAPEHQHGIVRAAFPQNRVQPAENRPH
jgi:hypothetical protein